MRPMCDFDLEVFFSRYEFTTRYNLGGSDLESVTLAELLALAAPEEREAWDKLYLGYTETYGAPALRDAIVSTYDHVSRDDLLCFAGAEEGIFCAMHALLGPDDHALVVYPCYQSAETVPAGICAVEGVGLDPENSWALDLDLLRTKIRADTKLIYVNFPHNPTGTILERARFDTLVDLCREHGIYLFSDEVYRLMERDEALRLPQAADLYERGLSLNVMSKAYGMAGLRIGWIACRDRDLLSRMERIKHYLSICNSAPSEVLTTIALKAREQILARNRALVDANLRLLDAFFAQRADLFAWKIPDGGCIAFPRYRGREGTDVLAERLVREAGVLIVPGGRFHSELGHVPADRFRIGFGRRYVPEALALLEQVV